MPSNEEWDKLYRFADGTSGTGSPYDSKTAGRFLKATSGWNSGGNGTDKYGFSALPGGYGYSNGTFYDVGTYSRWWSSSENNSDDAYYRDIVLKPPLKNSNYYGNGQLGSIWCAAPAPKAKNSNYYGNGKSHLYSVRCLQDM